MSYVESNNNEMKFVLTKQGKEMGLQHGLINILKYFSVSDNGVNYTMDVAPDKIPDINGSHNNTTNIKSCSTYKINK